MGLTLIDRNEKSIKQSIDELIAKISQKRIVIEKSHGAENLSELLNSRIVD